METTFFLIAGLVALLCFVLIFLYVRTHKKYKAEKKLKEAAVLEKQRTESVLKREINYYAELLKKIKASTEIIRIENPTRKECETDAAYIHRCRMSIGNKAAQLAEVSESFTQLTVTTAKELKNNL
jgi:hypothetical protein